MGANIPEFAESEKTYVQWKEQELRDIHNKYLNPKKITMPEPESEEVISDETWNIDPEVAKYVQESAAPEPEQEPEPAQSEPTSTAPHSRVVNPALSQEAYQAAQEERRRNGEYEQTYTDWVSEVVSSDPVRLQMAANSRTSAAPGPVPPPLPQGITRPGDPQSGAEGGKPRYKVPREAWVQYVRNPQKLAELLGVPFSDRGADRAGMTFNTHGPDDPLRVDSRCRIWFRDEVMKPAIPKRRMIRKVKAMSANVETIKTYRPDGGLDETFEIAGDDQREIEVRISMPSSQVGVYVDPRMPFKIHTYGGRRAFDYEEVMDYWGGRELVPSTVKTIYIDIDLCYTIDSVRDTIEREYRERVLGRSMGL